MGWDTDFFDSAVIEMKSCLRTVLAVDPTILLAGQGFVEASGTVDTIFDTQYSHPRIMSGPCPITCQFNLVYMNLERYLNLLTEYLLNY